MVHTYPPVYRRSQRLAVVVGVVVVLVGLLTGSVLASNAENSAQSPLCSDAYVTCIPHILSIESAYNQAELIFGDCGSICERLSISYGKDPNASDFGVEFMPEKTEQGLRYTITALDPNSTYYFKVRCVGDELCTQYSPIYTVRTSQCTVRLDVERNETETVRCTGTSTDAARMQQTTAAGSTDTSDTPSFSPKWLIIWTVFLGVLVVLWRVVLYEQTLMRVAPSKRRRHGRMVQIHKG